MGTAFKIKLFFMTLILMILIWLGNESSDSTMIACSSVTQCEIHGHFRSKQLCEEMKNKLEKNDNILEFICEGGDK